MSKNVPLAWKSGGSAGAVVLVATVVSPPEATFAKVRVIGTLEGGVTATVSPAGVAVVIGLSRQAPVLPKARISPLSLTAVTRLRSQPEPSVRLFRLRIPSLAVHTQG